MAEKKLTNELMRTFDGHGKIGAFKAGEKLTEYGSLVDVANHTGIHYRTLCHFKNKVLPNKRRDLSREISQDD